MCACFSRFGHAVTFGRGWFKVTKHVLNVARHQASGAMCVWQAPKSVRKTPKAGQNVKSWTFWSAVKSLIEVTKVDQKS
jgi:hypothetical protein